MPNPPPPDTAAGESLLAFAFGAGAEAGRGAAVYAGVIMPNRFQPPPPPPAPPLAGLAGVARGFACVRQGLE